MSPKRYPLLQEREIKTVVYRILKHLLKKQSEKEEEEGNVNFEKLNISLENFLNLNVYQISAFIFLKPNLLKLLKMEFSEKEFEINNLISNHKFLLQA